MIEKTMLQQFLSSLPFMTDARAQLVMDSFLPMVQAGFMVSLPLAMISFVCGILIAIGVALVRISPSDNILHHILLKLTKYYVGIIRGTPLLVQLSIVF